MKDPDAIKIDVIGIRNTKKDAIQALRQYFLIKNTRLLSLPGVPESIRALAERNIARNSSIAITVDADGVVFVDGFGPEMDYFTIMEIR